MIVERKNIKELSEKLKSDGKTIVFTNGCFDILHSGHVFYLQKAKEQGDILILGLNSDASVRRLKGEKRPINFELDRAIVISELKSIDYVVIFEEDTPQEIISLIVPDILVKGGDYKKEDVVGKDIVENNGGEVVIIPFVDGKSTTNIINKINE
ncbi:MAG: D-glycero-beta-D-manno-heptose 1-phosphate adenylyltransferase [Ignavibacteriae bacterium HGW-Ignavibacteriae-4]|jgi:glycerol-3-phosphate cytidylyltransferase|nr:MAG: D-glycero-beta-D-manno-heptose 1-phosphate adenylyltransferase [Ignavibacteriae bacterium HGW-Ignavibacteriae-4]